MTATLPANTELVTVTWLGGIAGLTPDMVAATLPKDNASWAASGFVTVRTVGGSPGMYAPLRAPVVTVDTWAVSPSSGKPPWFKANALAELIDAGCRASDVQRTLALPVNYHQARVLGAFLLSEPRRAYGDQGDYARYTTDLALRWVELQ